MSVPISASPGRSGHLIFLLWGQRGIMCTKPMDARPSESRYSWIPEILWDCLAYIRRTDGMDAPPCHASEP